MKRLVTPLAILLLLILSFWWFWSSTRRNQENGGLRPRAEKRAQGKSSPSTSTPSSQPPLPATATESAEPSVSAPPSEPQKPPPPSDAAASTPSKPPSEDTPPSSTQTGPETALPTLAEGQGRITGRILFSGTPDEKRSITGITTDKHCSTLHPDPVYSEELLIYKGRVQNVVVYIKPKKGDPLYGRKFPIPTEAVILDQKGCLFHPHIVAMMAGQTITVRNSDETAHNVHFNSLNSQDNKSQTSKGAEDSWTFSTSEVGGTVKCDIHSWMGARFCVFKHPYFAVTTEEGQYLIDGLPAGRYTLVAWHEELGELQTEVLLESKRTTALDFTFKKQ